MWSVILLEKVGGMTVRKIEHIGLEMTMESGEK